MTYSSDALDAKSRGSKHDPREVVGTICLIEVPTVVYSPLEAHCNRFSTWRDPLLVICDKVESRVPMDLFTHSLLTLHAADAALGSSLFRKSCRWQLLLVSIHRGTQFCIPLQRLDPGEWLSNTASSSMSNGCFRCACWPCSLLIPRSCRNKDI